VFNLVCRLTGTACIAAFVLCGFTPLPNLAYDRLRVRPALAPADAVVVLGGASQPDGTLHASSLRRAVHGIELHRTGFAPLVVFCGRPAAAGAPSEAAVRARLAETFGVPREAIVMEVPGVTTREESRLVAARLLPSGRRRILLVTGEQHMERARQAFEHEGFHVSPAPTVEHFGRSSRPSARFDLVRGLLQEVVARAYYRLAGAR
jgi:uncharacterized SAM-binding protein YcdF (DUF218 family)